METPFAMQVTLSRLYDDTYQTSLSTIFPKHTQNKRYKQATVPKSQKARTEKGFL
jgi:hypothetical protein